MLGRFARRRSRERTTSLFGAEVGRLEAGRRERRTLRRAVLQIGDCDVRRRAVGLSPASVQKLRRLVRRGQGLRGLGGLGVAVRWKWGGAERTTSTHDRKEGGA